MRLNGVLTMWLVLWLAVLQLGQAQISTEDATDVDSGSGSGSQSDEDSTEFSSEDSSSTEDTVTESITVASKAQQRAAQRAQLKALLAQKLRNSNVDRSGAGSRHLKPPAFSQRNDEQLSRLTATTSMPNNAAYATTATTAGVYRAAGQRNKWQNLRLTTTAAPTTTTTRNDITYDTRAGVNRAAVRVRNGQKARLVTTAAPPTSSLPNDATFAKTARKAAANRAAFARPAVVQPTARALAALRQSNPIALTTPQIAAAFEQRIDDEEQSTEYDNETPTTSTQTPEYFETDVEEQQSATLSTNSPYVITTTTQQARDNEYNDYEDADTTQPPFSPQYENSAYDITTTQSPTDNAYSDYDVADGTQPPYTEEYEYNPYDITTQRPGKATVNDYTSNDYDNANEYDEADFVYNAWRDNFYDQFADGTYVFGYSLPYGVRRYERSYHAAGGTVVEGFYTQLRQLGTFKKYELRCYRADHNGYHEAKLTYLNRPPVVQRDVVPDVHCLHADTVQQHE